jgi:hypothetical protein
MMMHADDVILFLEGRKIYVFEPDTHTLVAVVDYELGGRCAVQFSAGDADVGVYGFDGDAYWTRYEKFRNGETHVFHLKSLGPGIAQAYFADGTKAFLQSQSTDLAGIVEV